MGATDYLRVHALHTSQNQIPVYSFFLAGERILEIADIARINRVNGEVEGFQRQEIRAHVRSIADYLDGTDVLFPNAIVLAIAGDIEFKAKRGTKNTAVDDSSNSGVLSIPIRSSRKSIWIVDGQQRALAFTQSKGASLPVPVIAFVSPDVAVHREQFILVNKARPLDRRLIDELLPSVEVTSLPRDLVKRRVPSALCSALNDTPGSPFYKLVKRASDKGAGAVVTDSSLTTVIRTSLKDPRGALAAHADPGGKADLDAMYHIMVTFWSAVRDTFPEAWGLPPEKSRLMHAAGLAAMGVLMDQVMTSIHGDDNAREKALYTLTRIAPHCRWTEGRWEEIDRDWDDIQCTTKDIRSLSNVLVSLERRVMREVAA